MARIPCAESSVEPLSPFVITPDKGKMSDTRLEEGYHHKIERFFVSIRILCLDFLRFVLKTHKFFLFWILFMIGRYLFQSNPSDLWCFYFVMLKSGL